MFSCLGFSGEIFLLNTTLLLFQAYLISIGHFDFVMPRNEASGRVSLFNMPKSCKC